MTEIIGWSKEGRPLIVDHFGDERAPLRALIIAGQHGDERYGRRAAESFTKPYPSIQLAVLADANPDGAFGKSRANADGVDLNRDHQLLCAAETLAIHRFVRRWEPHLIIDAHNYPPRRRHLIERGLVAHYDVFVDLPTHPAIKMAGGEERQNDLLFAVRSDLAAGGFDGERYTLVKKSGRVRHSTSDVVDARNGLSLRYGALTALIEARAPTREDGREGRERAVAAGRAAIESVLRWAARHAEWLTRGDRAVGREGERVAIRCRYRTASEPCLLKFRDAANGTVNVVTFPEFRPHVEVTRQAKLPVAYAVPLAKEKVIEVLRRHGFRFRAATPLDAGLIESYLVETVKAPRKRRAAARIAGVAQRREQPLRDYVIFPVEQAGGRSLAVFLEPESKHGLHRYSELELTPKEGEFYPILRVLSR
jgi:hypothetical protein